MGRPRPIPRAGATALAATLVIALAGAGEAEAVVNDFNGDGRSDLAVGVPYDGPLNSGGSVNVLYAKRNGIRVKGDELIHADKPGFKGERAAGDLYAWALVGGDFNGDRRWDLAVGIRGADPDNGSGALADAGAVHVIYGTNRGLGPRRDKRFSQDKAMPGTADSGGHYGSALATGDFDGDGRHDLAVGIPAEDEEGGLAIGAVQVLYGSGRGLRRAGAQLFTQDSDGIEGVAESGDAFGSSLTSGDFDGDGRDDLAVGVPGEEAPGEPANHGIAQTIYGSKNEGLQGDGGEQFWHGSEAGLPGDAAAGERFGHSLAAADFDKDGYDELAAGVPGDAGGSVQVLGGTAGGLTTEEEQYLTQDTPGVPGERQSADLFGTSLAAGKFDRGGHWDLAVGSFGEGTANVLYGGGLENGGLAGGQLFSQDMPPEIEDESEFSDWFGAAVTSGRFGNDKRWDLVVGVPKEDLTGPIADAGAVNTIYGRRNGLRAKGNQFLHQDIPGLAGAAAGGESFGRSLPGSGAFLDSTF